MKLAIIGSRGIKNIDLKEYIASDVDEIVSGGAKGGEKASDIATKTFVNYMDDFLEPYIGNKNNEVHAYEIKRAMKMALSLANDAVSRQVNAKIEMYMRILIIVNVYSA